MKTISILSLALTIFVCGQLLAPRYSNGVPANVKALMWTPANAVVANIDAQTVEVSGGAGFEYIALDKSGKLIPGTISKAAISCKCNSGSGCSPFSGHGQQGCALNGCTNCTGSVSVKTPSGTIEVSGGGFMRSNVQVGFATKSDLQKSALAFNAMMKLPKVQNALTAFTQSYANESSGEKVWVAIKIGGRISTLEVPKSVAIKNNAVILSAKGSCSCTDGTCTYGSSMGVSYCNSNCSGTCSLTTSLKASGNEVAVESYNF